jgi:TP901 family phage tail tape measure protein
MALKASLIVTAQDAASGVLGRIAGTLDSINSKMGTTAASSQRTAAHLAEAAVAAGKVAEFARRAVTVPTDAFQGFEHEMLRVRGLMNLSAKDYQKVTNEARRLGSELGEFTALDAAKGFSELGMAGQNAAQSIASMPANLNLSTAAQVPLAEAIAITTGIMGQFNIEAKDTESVTDVLTATFTGSKTTLRTLGETYKFAGKVAADSKIPFQDLALMAGMLGNSSLDASMAGTSLRAMILNLGGAARGPGRKALKTMGVALTKLGDDGKRVERNVFDILRDIRNVTKKMNPEMKKMALTRIFGKQAITGVLTMMAALDTDKFVKLQKEIAESKKRTQSLAEMQRTSAKSGAMEMASAAEGLYIVLGKSLAPVLGILRTMLTNVFIILTKLAERFPVFSTGVMVAVGAVALLATGLTGALLAMSTFASVIAVASTAMGVNVTGAMIMAKTLTWLKTALIAGKSAMVSVGAASWAAAGPIAIAAAAIAIVGGLAYVIYRNWEPIHRWFRGAWERFTMASLGAKAVMIAIAAAAAVVVGPMGAAAHAIAGLAKQIEGFVDGSITVGDVVDDIVDKFKSLIDWAQKLATNRYVQTAWTMIGGAAIMKMGRMLTGGPNVVGAIGRANLAATRPATAAAGAGALDALKAIGRTNLAAAAPIGQYVGGIASEIYDTGSAGYNAATPDQQSPGGKLQVQLKIDQETGQVKEARVEQSGDYDIMVDAGMSIPAGF